MRKIVVTLFIILSVHLTVAAQAKVEAPASSATIEELHRWVVNTMTKYASYKTRVTAVKITEVSADGCKLTYTSTRQNSITSQDKLGATRRTSSVKDNVILNLGEIERDGITLEPHIHPELETVVVTAGKAPSKRVTEIVVKREAADVFASVLERIAAQCRPKS